MDSVYLSAVELAKRLGVSRNSIFRMRRDGRLPEAVRLGKRITRWHWPTVEAHLAAKATGVHKPAPQTNRE